MVPLGINTSLLHEGYSVRYPRVKGYVNDSHSVLGVLEIR
jgi:hypothetical protein